MITSRPNIRPWCSVVWAWWLMITAALQHCSTAACSPAQSLLIGCSRRSTQKLWPTCSGGEQPAALQHCSTRYTGPGDGAVCCITLLIWREFICNTGAVFPIPHRYSQCYPQNLKLLLLYFEDFTEWARFRSFYWLKKRNTQKMRKWQWARW